MATKCDTCRYRNPFSQANVKVCAECCAFNKYVSMSEDSSPDANVEAIREKLLYRSKVGLEKYGVTTERKDLTTLQWLIHLQEELIDATVYIEAAIKSGSLK